VLKLTRELREEMEDLIDYLELLEASMLYFGKKRYIRVQVRKMLGMK